MKRREILKYAAVATGAALSAPIILSLNSCKPDDFVKVENYKPTFFNDAQFNTLQSVVDFILPETDSPSASDLGVHQMIDNMVGNVYTEENRTKYKESFEELYRQLTTGKDFAKENETSQKEIISALNGKAVEAFREIKQQSVAYYLNTEEIGTKFLNYLPVPGKYEGCISLESVGGKKWAI
ncbi:gluconate 2-dehydrogenase subunit 3 family protein [Portibacter lacus]|uniref:Gluconate 2-dehydrogenase subunit 3 family protein n=1 Tax=Portibacter lacus TaxID=1099794 RepID=A0AA37WCE5_9BACT|nr:gluconate 2-dehydrogenase subunit 3 family protein [Portibacter lacus]GLR16421.1 hypothetical protein GCM10007940_10360 [Portibacter lacus]